MSTFSSLQDLTRYVQDNINEVLEDEVLDAVRTVMLRHVEADVYDKYSPREYVRRREDGGLSDPDNIVSDLASDGVVWIGNSAEFSQNPPSDNYGWELSGLVEFGDGWDGYYYEYQISGRPYMQPRPFISNTRQELKSTKPHIAAMKKGLQSRGIKCS